MTITREEIAAIRAELDDSVPYYFPRVLDALVEALDALEQSQRDVVAIVDRIDVLLAKIDDLIPPEETRA